MNNADKFKQIFDLSATELWAMSEKDFLAWLNAERDVKHGKWIDWHYSGFDGVRVWRRECSVCGYERDDDNPDKDTNFCPNCGSKMEIE